MSLSVTSCFGAENRVCQTLSELTDAGADEKSRRSGHNG